VYNLSEVEERLAVSAS